MELKVHKITNSKRGQNITAESLEKDPMDEIQCCFLGSSSRTETAE